MGKWTNGTASLYKTRMLEKTTFLESLHYVPEPGWTRTAFSVLRAGKVAAAPDYRVARAVHPGQDVIYCLSGGGTVETLGQRLEVRPGQLAWIANEAPHAHMADPADPWTVLWFRLDGPDPAALRAKLFGDGPPRVAFAESANPAAWFDRLFVAMRGRDARLDLRLNQFVAEFLTMVDHALAGTAAQNVPAPLAAALGAMRADLGLPWSASDLSAVTGLGHSQTRRLFRKHLRTGPRQWLIRERLMHAQALLVESDAPLAEIAEQCGFCDVYHFGREFKRSVGIAPAAWRRSELGARPKA
ncbi:AraC family transcriptional regulator [Mesorhizobium ephedrae]|uniref:AraC family transcriptional regulator n=2 Tax=Kumtagia ephedrae TaxID=2116701 RepID=A0A2P7S7Q4_9HYPH|nr:AraC family transcriptional regulator [Mesorhizobium ephedrae]